MRNSNQFRDQNRTRDVWNHAWSWKLRWACNEKKSPFAWINFRKDPSAVVPRFFFPELVSFSAVARKGMWVIQQWYLPASGCGYPYPPLACRTRLLPTFRCGYPYPPLAHLRCGYPYPPLARLPVWLPIPAFCPPPGVATPCSFFCPCFICPPAPPSAPSSCFLNSSILWTHCRIWDSLLCLFWIGTEQKLWRLARQFSIWHRLENTAVTVLDCSCISFELAEDCADDGHKMCDQVALLLLNEYLPAFEPPMVPGI